ncbi:hypothetical protein AY599_02380 [Leptolyngbya valderiana BDU 20041]|nr:hypothetical protein AY599_02380 [Leptolyngbya valderiana BDU 20041]PPT10958.1 hypothetical protein CKA32_002836 [Geitlerinema sp. FC II]
MMKSQTSRFQRFEDFYPYYLQAHENPTCRRLHVLGLGVAIAAVGYAIVTQTWWALAIAPGFGYPCAWLGHAYFGKNVPATFGYPLYSFKAGILMYRDMLKGDVPF